MHQRKALSAALVAATLGGAAGAPLRAQPAPAKVETAPRFALFGGRSASQNDPGSGPENGREFGASGDFRWSAIPVPLRLSLSFSARDVPHMFRPQRGGKSSLELVMRPVPRWLGIRPYFLGGLGLATRAPYSAIGTTSPFDPIAPSTSFTYSRPRETWSFASAGFGLDVWRVFAQLKYETPVASQGPNLLPVAIGFRF